MYSSTMHTQLRTSFYGLITAGALLACVLYVILINSPCTRHVISHRFNPSYTGQQKPDLIVKSGDKRDIPGIFLSIRDFYYFPCLTGISSSTELHNHARCVRSVNVSLTSQLVPSDDCVTLKMDNNSTPMCVHDPRRDRVISAWVFITGSWEKKLVTQLVNILIKDPDKDLLDIGCNIGAYTLAAAKNGKRVVAVDANKENLILLSKSLVLGNIKEGVTLIWNALSSTYTSMSIKERHLNIGGNRVESYTANDNKSTTGLHVTESIRLDDLQGLFTNRKVLIKMDVEEHEVEVLDGGSKFLSNVNVRYVQMEMVFHRNQPSGNIIVNRLKGYGFYPFTDCLGHELLSDTDIKEWPIDVCFVKL